MRLGTNKSAGEGTTIVSYFATDSAGNAEAPETLTVQLDKSPPTISLTTPTAGATYLLNVSVPANYNCSDGFSGVASCTGTTPNGANLDTSSVGMHSFAIQAVDLAGNSTTQSVSYVVQYSFNGFGSPIVNSPYINAVSAGSTVPVKWQLQDANGAYVSSLSSFLSLVSYPVTCPGAPAVAISSSTTTGDSTPHYDSSSNQFVYNWKTDGSWSGCRTLSVTLADGTSHRALFQFLQH